VPSTYTSGTLTKGLSLSPRWAFRQRCLEILQHGADFRQPGELDRGHSDLGPHLAATHMYHSHHTVFLTQVGFMASHLQGSVRGLKLCCCHDNIIYDFTLNFCKWIQWAVRCKCIVRTQYVCVPLVTSSHQPCGQLKARVFWKLPESRMCMYQEVK
jgi:hypothetical protein